MVFFASAKMGQRRRLNRLDLLSLPAPPAFSQAQVKGVQTAIDRTCFRVDSEPPAPRGRPLAEAGRRCLSPPRWAGCAGCCFPTPDERVNSPVGGPNVPALYMREKHKQTVKRKPQ